MSLFQCENCGCAENTALSLSGFQYLKDNFNWNGIENLYGLKLCSACGPSTYKNGSITGYGIWHNQFKRRYLPLGLFKTNRVGNLEHIKNGDQDYPKYEIQRE